jgi:hypothetical protein
LTARLLPVLLLLAAAPAAAAEKSIAERARTHWAFQPVRRPAVPAVRNAAWPQTPIDHFLLVRMEAAGVSPAPRADRATLLRRITLDLTGLPPTPDEIDTFLADGRPDAYERLVDRLLASPAYGERWGRHWLDVARYADTNGYERDGDKPGAWRYRDYVIDAFNRDLSYDRFVTEQLAGDEMPGSDARTQTATTFLRLGTWDDEPANATVDRYDQLDDVLGTTATAFLAQTIRCARCHDHKYEPFSQKEYYRLLSVFTPLRRPQRGRADLDYPVGAPQEVAAYRAAAARSEARRLELGRQIAALKAKLTARVLADGGKLPPAVREAFRTTPGKRTAVQKQLVRTNKVRLEDAATASATAEETQELVALIRRQNEHVKRPLAGLARAYVWFEDGPAAPATHLFRRGNPGLVGAEVRPGVPAVLAPVPPPPPAPLAHSTGRRLWLARWVASADNPLTARVMVNRVWQEHFGRGLAATAGDFGLMGEPPSHPELLDYLAGEFVRGGWGLKRLHRLIVRSAAYQAGSMPAGPGADGAPGLFGRYRQRRLDAEAVRDGMLAVSGALNRQQGGPGVYPRLPAAVLAGQSRPGSGWGRSDERQSARRSVYVFAKRTLALPELELLDAPEGASSCECRQTSTTAPQALTFLNGAFSHEQAGRFADRLLREAGEAPAAQVRRAFLLALGRAAGAAETRRSLDFLRRQERLIAAEEPGRAGGARRRALASFCLVLFNANEFFYPG